MADRRRNDILVIFVEVCVLFELAERLGDVPGDRRFFRDDKSFAHLLRGKLAEKIYFVNTGDWICLRDTLLLAAILL
jgi:hypothetical protein